ncbi:MAG: HAD-IIA family hydrolase [Canibacter sp.]
MRLTWYEAYVFDMDGTIYLGSELLDGAKQLIDKLREREIPVRYVTNNPSLSPEQYAEKLTSLGLATDEHEVFNTLEVSVNWLKKHEPDQTVYPIAGPELVKALKDNGMRLSSDPNEVDIVLASYDRNFNYEKLSVAFQALWRNDDVRLMATNPDVYCPLPGGNGEPDTGSIVAAISAASGAELDRHFGKPNAEMVEVALQEIGVDPENAVMVGDRLATDIQMAYAAGCDSALVLTGDSNAQEVDALPLELRPTHMIETLAELIPDG